MTTILLPCALLGVIGGPGGLLMYGDFSEGLAGWTLATAAEHVTVGALADGPAPAAVLLDARTSLQEVGLVSDPVPIVPSQRYEVEALVQRIEGDRRFKVSFEWLDQTGRHVSYDNSWTGWLIGSDWERHYARAVAPMEARTVRLLIGVEPGCACRMTAITLTELARDEATLAIDLFPDCLGTPDSRLNARLENTGSQTLEDLEVRLECTPSLQVGDGASANLDRLEPGGVMSLAPALTHGPAVEDAYPMVRCRVRARSGGRTVSFEQSAQPFVTRGEVRTVDSADLPSPIRPPTSVKLGCYYFPVMLDWDRSGWGVRPVDYLEPLLGYYDEALPEVADWHIHWAVEHGISTFVFDWYYNQGMEYLNDALDLGFLGSRFADEMGFCIDWCNEGHCQEFRPLDFSTPSLEGFIRTLCEKYFVRSNYLRIEGRPVVLIHQPLRVANAHGGWAGCAQALEAMRAVARGYGHPGVHFVAVQNDPCLMEYAKGGFDGATAYAYGFRDVAKGTWDDTGREMPFAALMPRHDACFEEARQAAHAQGLRYIPSAWIGWDDAGRSNEQAVRTEGNTPAAFRRMLQSLPLFAEEAPPRLALFEAWNEWGEGGSAEPGIQYGFGYLDAIRDALSTERGPHVDYVPTPASRAAMQTTLAFDEINAHYYQRYADKIGLSGALDMEFASVYDLWLRPAGQVASVRIEREMLVGESVGHDPQLLSPPALGLAAEQCPTIELRMSAAGGDEARIYWKDSLTVGWSEERSAAVSLVADGELHDYAIDVSAHPAWLGRIYGLRIDPMDAPGAFAIDRLRVAPAGR